jgi:hypothetical protein
VINVIPTDAPDLTTSGTTPTSVVVDTDREYQATITNIGNANANNFSNLFQTANSLDVDGNGVEVSRFRVSGTISLAPVSVSGATFLVKYTHRFTFVDTKYVRFCADLPDDDVNESNEGNNCGAWTRVDVTATPTIDLTASVPAYRTPITSRENTTFTSRISNNGSAITTGPNVNNLFLFDSDENHTNGNTTEIPVATSGPIAGGSTTNVSVSNRLSAGRWYIKVCADKTTESDRFGLVVESREDNNCNDGTNEWTVVEVNNSVPVDGSCGGSRNSCTPPSTLSSVPSPTQDPNSYIWYCDGVNGGIQVRCLENKTPVVSCGLAHTGFSSTKPTNTPPNSPNNLCSDGLNRTVNLNGSKWEWSCRNLVPAECWAKKAKKPGYEEN